MPAHWGTMEENIIASPVKYSVLKSEVPRFDAKYYGASVRDDLLLCFFCSWAPDPARWPCAARERRRRECTAPTAAGWPLPSLWDNDRCARSHAAGWGLLPAAPPRRSRKTHAVPWLTSSPLRRSVVLQTCKTEVYEPNSGHKHDLGSTVAQSKRLLSNTRGSKDRFKVRPKPDLPLRAAAPALAFRCNQHPPPHAPLPVAVSAGGPPRGHPDPPGAAEDGHGRPRAECVANPSI